MVNSIAIFKFDCKFHTGFFELAIVGFSINLLLVLLVLVLVQLINFSIIRFRNALGEKSFSPRYIRVRCEMRASFAAAIRSAAVFMENTAELESIDESPMGMGCCLSRSSLAEGAVPSRSSCASLDLARCFVAALSFLGEEMSLETDSDRQWSRMFRAVVGVRSAVIWPEFSLHALSRARAINLSRSRLKPRFLNFFSFANFFVARFASFIRVASAVAACCSCESLRTFLGALAEWVSGSTPFGARFF